MNSTIIQQISKDMYQFDIQFEVFELLNKYSSSRLNLPLQITEVKQMFVQSNIKTIKFYQKLVRFGTQYPHLLLHSFRYVLEQHFDSLRFKIV
jgi:hypothetical protein